MHKLGVQNGREFFFRGGRVVISTTTSKIKACGTGKRKARLKREVHIVARAEAQIRYKSRNHRCLRLHPLFMHLRGASYAFSNIDINGIVYLT